MSISKCKKTLISLLISTSLLSAPIYATEQLNQTAASIEQSKTKTFPETLQALIDAPSKKDEIIIPMSKKVYETDIQGDLGDTQQGKIKASFVSVSYDKELVLVKFNTNVKETTIKIEDNSSGFMFNYNFANGYILSTDIYKFIKDDENGSDKLNYLSNAFDKYLTDKGFTKKSSFFSNITDLFSKETEYHLDNHIVIITKADNIMYKMFLVTMKNKEIEDNIDEIMKAVKEANLQYEYQGLSKILK